MNRAIFLDRDGVLIEDANLLISSKNIKIFEDVPQALLKLKTAGFLLIIISNQTVVARGMMTEKGMIELNNKIIARLIKKGSPQINAFYHCPHHPKATVPSYRQNCNCRKPKPGMILRAAHEHDIDLQNSYVIGDRITDIIAGSKAGCSTVLVRTGMHTSPPIETADVLDPSISPDFTCDSLFEAAEWVLARYTN